MPKKNPHNSNREDLFQSMLQMQQKWQKELSQITSDYSKAITQLSLIQKELEAQRLSFFSKYKWLIIPVVIIFFLVLSLQIMHKLNLCTDEFGFNFNEQSIVCKNSNGNIIVSEE